MNLKFPSPYGVSFILIELGKEVYYNFNYGEFPSPYGVSFILIEKFSNTGHKEYKCFRLLTEYHSFLY